MQLNKRIAPILMAVSMMLTSISPVSASSPDLSEIPEYSGEAYTVLNDNVPDFSADDFTSSCALLTATPRSALRTISASFG